MKPLLCAALLLTVWMLTTWLLEGRIETLLRPEAVMDRVLYALIANVAVGIIGGMVAVGLLFRWHAATPATAGLASWRRSAAAIAAAISFGLPYYLFAGGSVGNAILVANVFAQVLVVSAAEVIVCWSVVGSVARSSLAAVIPRGSAVLAGVVSSAAFGLYHFAHSAPFNSTDTVVFLSIAGLVTSAFFLVSRDLLGTLIFHNFPATAGVMQALLTTGVVPPGDTLQIPLMASVALTLIMLVLSRRLLLLHHTPNSRESTSSRYRS